MIVGGHATIGGLGPASRMWGAALDHIVGATVVLADGSVANCSTTENPDLFWAIRGAGASFGVITEFQVFTHPAPPALAYSYSFSGRPYAGLAKRFKEWQAMVARPDLSLKIASEAILSELGLIIEGTFFGTQAEFEALNLTTFLPNFPDPNVVVFEDWAGLLGHWAESAGLEIGGGIPNAFYAKSLVFTADNLVPDSGIDALFQYLDRADKGTLLWFGIFDFQGGHTNTIPQDATAFGHRDALVYWQGYVSTILPPLSQKSISFMENATAILANSVPGSLNNGAYPGYVDPELGQSGQVAYWDSNYPRLQQVKKVLDPNDMFHNPQSVRLP
jgi:FAD/FMN-containing dehydrogenase